MVKYYLETESVSGTVVCFHWSDYPGYDDDINSAVVFVFIYWSCLFCCWIMSLKGKPRV